MPFLLQFALILNIIQFDLVNSATASMVRHSSTAKNCNWMRAKTNSLLNYSSKIYEAYLPKVQGSKSFKGCHFPHSLRLLCFIDYNIDFVLKLFDKVDETFVLTFKVPRSAHVRNVLGEEQNVIQVVCIKAVKWFVYCWQSCNYCCNPLASDC